MMCMVLCMYDKSIPCPCLTKMLDTTMMVCHAGAREEGSGVT